MKERLRNQTVRRDDAGSFAVGRRVHGRRVFDRIEFALRFDRFANLVVFRDSDSSNPRHNLSFPFPLNVCDETPTGKTAGPAKKPRPRETPASDYCRRATRASTQSTRETRSASLDTPASDSRRLPTRAGAV